MTARKSTSSRSKAAREQAEETAPEATPQASPEAQASNNNPDTAAMADDPGSVTIDPGMPVTDPLDPGPVPDLKKTQTALRVSDPFTSRFVYGDGEEDFLDHGWKTVSNTDAKSILTSAESVGVQIEEGTD